MKIFTIGHSSHSSDELIHLLDAQQVKLVVDVRTAPYSRYYPWFNKKDLQFNLKQREIDYQFSGKYLGGRPSEASLYKVKELPAEDIDYLHEFDYSWVSCD